MNQSESRSEGSRDFITIPPRPSCSSAQSVRDLGVASRVPERGANQHVLGATEGVCVCVTLNVCVCVCVQALICYEGGPPGLV